MNLSLLAPFATGRSPALQSRPGEEFTYWAGVGVRLRCRIKSPDKNFVDFAAAGSGWHGYAMIRTSRQHDDVFIVVKTTDLIAAVREVCGD